MTPRRIPAAQAPTLALALTFALTLAGAAMAQSQTSPTPPPRAPSQAGPSRPVVAPPPDVTPRARPRLEKWEDIPQPLRGKLEMRIQPQPFQAVVRMEASAAQPEPRMTEPGSRLATQKVSPAHGARLLDAPDRPALGGVGSVLWQAKDGEKEYWCRLGERSILRAVNRVYCFRDLDRDGAFDRVLTLEFTGSDSFQSFAPGLGAIIEKPLRYESAPPPAYSEILTLVYAGLLKGEIDRSDHIRNGYVRFTIQYGDPSKPLTVSQTLEVPLDSKGAASGVTPTGHYVMIDQVEVGGRARIRVLGAPPSGEGFVLPAVTQESLLEELRLRLLFER